MYIGLVLFFSSSVQNLPTQDCDGPSPLYQSVIRWSASWEGILGSMHPYIPEVTQKGMTDSHITKRIEDRILPWSGFELAPAGSHISWVRSSNIHGAPLQQNMMTNPRIEPVTWQEKRWSLTTVSIGDKIKSFMRRYPRYAPLHTWSIVLGQVWVSISRRNQDISLGSFKGSQTTKKK